MAWNVPSAFTALSVLTAAQLNQIRDSLKAIGDPWTTYVPTTTNVTLGNGTLSAASVQAGKLTQVRIKLTFGTTTALTGAPTFSLPIAATAVRTVVASVVLYDASAGNPHKGGFGINTSTTTLALRDTADAALSSTAPFTWTTADEIIINVTYEAA